MNLFSPLTELKGVGAQVAKKLANIKLFTVQDLLLHLPLRYQDKTKITPISRLISGESALIEGIIISAERRYGRTKSLLCKIEDESAIISIRLFHYNQYQAKQLSEQTKIRCFGEAKVTFNGLEMMHPEYQIIKDKPPALETSLTPVYPITAGIQQKRLRGFMQQVLPVIEDLPELLDADQQLNNSKHPVEDNLVSTELSPVKGVNSVLTNNKLTVKQAVQTLHFPQATTSANELMVARDRLAFEELLANYLGLRQLRMQQQQMAAPAFSKNSHSAEQLLEILPFSLTNAQRRVVQEINQDLVQPFPMQRLVQGDVGSGKTVVALLAALQAIDAGYQVALMAPTELLAEQHYLTIKSWLDSLSIAVGWLSGKQKAKVKAASLTAIANGESRLVVGTHALFQKDVSFAKLGLIIIDEQHRFGVLQRAELRAKGMHQTVDNKELFPHTLVMTATPIPRTLAMTAYADLEHSIIDELPAGRTPIDTSTIVQDRRDELLQRVYTACRSGQQAYWVSPLVTESEFLDAQSAEKTAEWLQAEASTLNIGLVHGQMKEHEKEQAMTDFRTGKIDILAATTVVEVGVDVPNASLMVIENAERLGLAQLHQLRGRVGRGAKKSHTILLYKSPLSAVAKQRLAIMRETTNGFKIAEKDLELRGAGEILGTRQTGAILFRIADLSIDHHLLPKIEVIGKQLLTSSPQIAEQLVKRWLKPSD